MSASGPGRPPGAPDGAGGPAGREARWCEYCRLMAQLLEVQDLLRRESPGELLETGPKRIVIEADRLAGDPVLLEISMINFMAEGEPHIEVSSASGRKAHAVMHSRRYAQQASEAAGPEFSLVEFVRAFRQFFTAEGQCCQERQSEPSMVLLLLQAEMDYLCYCLSGGDAGDLLRKPPGILPLQRSREADPPPDGGSSGRVPLRLLGKDDARGTIDLRLDVGVSVDAVEDLGVDVRVTVTARYPGDPIRVEALEAWGGGEDQREFMRAVVGQAQAARTQAAPGGQEHFASLVQGLYSRILRLSRNCNLQMPPAAAEGEWAVEADTVPGRAAAKPSCTGSLLAAGNPCGVRPCGRNQTAAEPPPPTPGVGHLV